MIYYKVVRKLISGNLVSASMGDVIYMPGKKVFPSVGWGPLCVFSTVGNARAFIRKNFDYFDSRLEYKIFSCEIEKTLHTQIWIPNSIRSPMVILPEGTVLARWVKLLEEVPETKLSD